jgi:dihydroxy-acid dehydratase
VDEGELARRRAAWQPPARPKRGWDKLVHEQVLQAPAGADLAFLRPEGH